MEFNPRWLYPTTTLETLLKVRPQALLLLEKLGINPWNRLHDRAGEASAAGGMPWQAFVEGVEGLQPAPEGSDWAAVPVCLLLDRLAEDHRYFLFDIIPSIGHALSKDIDGDAASLLRLRQVAAAWPAFVATLSEHIREEEGALFLRILRYDYWLRRGDADPDFEGGSVRVFTAVRMLNQGHRDLKLMRDFLDTVQPLTGSPASGNALETSLRPLLAQFQARLGRHAQVETELLFPLAVELERRVYDLQIRGGRAKVAQPGEAREIQRGVPGRGAPSAQSVPG